MKTPSVPEKQFQNRTTRLVKTYWEGGGDGRGLEFNFCISYKPKGGGGQGGKDNSSKSCYTCMLNTIQIVIK
jgi:hypothetical protein